MPIYTRPQLALLLLVILTAGVGLGVGHWRRTHPELAERLERFDRVAIPAPATVDEPPATPVRRASPAATPARTTPAKTAPPDRPLDINTAGEAELRALPGIGGVLAARIVESREREGLFASLDELRRVRGLGRAKLERLAAAIALGP